ncbi:EamA family transporter [Nocardioides sp. TRM66260-LWL]|uniref:EamA family transporter n=1 Tax=Nocardioides sp. TRM66260-LWL TaxID=2874478 RepID=UPI001CC489FB|nr:EamA family transporter [Nocardioides sp. TRM66260-LWL]MBZ5733075.1 EamA family transporter [Nocardioides sp. TRM66260-LWL]
MLGSPVLLVLVGIVSVQGGAAVAKGLFDEVSPTGLVWLRLTTSLLVLLAVVRPRLRGRSRADWLVAAGFGLSLATMNWSIYQSFLRIPLGVAVTIEFTGPLLLAVLGSRRARDLVWVALAGLGVALLGLDGRGLSWSGVAFALLAGAAWAAYLLLSARTGRHWEGLDGLVVASGVAVLALTPAMLATGTAALTSTHVLLLGAAVGVLSSVVPYSLELIALRSLTPAVVGVLMSLEPAAAALAGLLLVHERLGVVQCLAIACVVVASAGATRAAAPPADAPAASAVEVPPPAA